MTLARTALRLAAVQIVKGTAASRPTIAGKSVFDSRMSPEQPEDFTQDASAVVIVFSDGDEGDALSDQNGGPPFRRVIDLVFDIGMVCRENDPDEAGAYIIGYPDTDARLEASIDVLQAQIIRQIANSTDPLALWFQNHVRIWKQESHRQVEDGVAVKLARRVLTLTCELADDEHENLGPGDAEPSGLARLPEPLRTVAGLMPAGSSGGDACAAIAAQLGLLPADGTYFGGVDMTVDAGDPRGVADDQVKAKANTDQEIPEEED